MNIELKFRAFFKPMEKVLEVIELSLRSKNKWVKSRRNEVMK